MGNGLLGALLWGEGRTLRVSLDRGDLWDNRHPDRILAADYTWKEIQAAVQRGNQGEIVRRFDSTYNSRYPTKLPGGRLEIDLTPGQDVSTFALDLSEAVGRVEAGPQLVLEGLCAAHAPVALFRLPGASPSALRLRPPAAVTKLGYPAAKEGKEAGFIWFRQPAAKGLTYAAGVATLRVGDATLLAASIQSTWDGTDPVPVLRQILDDALASGWQDALAAHREYWRRFWGASGVSIPDLPILRHYYLVNYYLGSASRPSAPPMPLQGVWTADSGGLPPWHGDFHHDLNTQMTYLSYLAAGHFEEGRVFLDFMAGRLPVFERFAKRFYETPGAAIPGVMSLDGEPMGGWIQYSLSPTNGAWVAWMFYRHWLYTREPGDLAKAYRFDAAIGTCLEALLRPDADGTLTLPLSSSPEIFNNSLRAWLPPNSNYDRACMKALFDGLGHMAREQRDSEAAARWSRVADRLGPRHVDADSILMFAANAPFHESHRHHSHMMAIHPFGMLNTEGSDADRRIIDRTMAQVDKLGTRAWCGYSFSWMACLRARVGRAEEAIRYLDIYERAFILRNGFHANGDQLRAGFSGFTYRPFTLEGNSLAVEAVHEMLLQSWGGTIRVFPATPWRWHDASFENLRAEGGFKVSARRHNNATVQLSIEATRAGTCRLRDPFAGRNPSWDRAVTRQPDGVLAVPLTAGEALEGRCDAPEELPPAPADVARPLVVHRQIISPNQLPLRIGADSNGENRFVGDIARASVFTRPLTPEEIAALAATLDSGTPGPAGLLACWTMDDIGGKGIEDAAGGMAARVIGKARIIAVDGGPAGHAVHLDGASYLEIPHSNRLNCQDGFTLEAWIRPARELPANGARIVDKSPAGRATGYLLDTYPGRSLRLIVRDPHVAYDARLPVGQWSHVAGTVNAETGRAVLYLNGKPVAEHDF